MKRTALPRGSAPLRRTRLRPASAKTVAARPSKAVVRQEVFERDRWRCRFHAHRWLCTGPLTVHHLAKSSACGPYSLGNLVCLCAGANAWVEDYPLEAEALGLVQRAGQTPEKTWAKLHQARLAASPEVGSGPWTA